MDKLARSEEVFFLDFSNIKDVPLSKKTREYIQHGEEQKLHERFKCRTREPWYQLPIISPAEGFMFKRAHNFHRVLINAAEAYTTDGAYQIRMKNGYKIQDFIYSFYNSLTAVFAEAEGRFYGGGVLELTPNEFRTLPIVFVEPTESEFEKFIHNFPNPGDFSKTQFSFGDAWLKEKLKLNNEEISKIQNALITLRNHRLRHMNKSICF